MKEGWKLIKLKDACSKLFAGGDVPKDFFSEFRTDEFPVPIFTNGEKNKGLYGFTKVARVTEPSITISARGTIGYTEVRKESFYPAIRLIVVTPCEDILDLSFLKYYFSAIDFSSSGTSIPQLTVPMVKELTIPIPPPTEQKRIVAFLNECFIAITKAKANAEQNLRNAQDLFESYLEVIFSNDESKWGMKEFGKVCELIGGSQPPKDDFIYEPKNGYIRLIQIRDYKTDKYITYIPENKARRFCSSTDIMIGRYGPPIFGIFRGLEGAYNVALMKAVPNEKYLLPDFLFWFLKNRRIREFVEHSSKRAAGQDGVRKELLEDYPVPIPAIEVQEQIVKQIVYLDTETKKLELIYQKKLGALEELQKTILQKAFAGELITDKILEAV